MCLTKQHTNTTACMPCHCIKMLESSDPENQDLCMAMAEIINMVDKLSSNYSNYKKNYSPVLENSTSHTKQNEIHEDIIDIKCVLERFLRSLLMAPVHRRLHMSPPHHKYTKEQLEHAWAEQAASLRKHTAQHSH